MSVQGYDPMLELHSGDMRLESELAQIELSVMDYEDKDTFFDSGMYEVVVCSHEGPLLKSTGVVDANERVCGLCRLSQGMA